LGVSKIPAQTAVEIWPWSLHRDPKYWTNAEEFNPERFERGEPSHRFAYLPFSLGPRACIGNKLAEIEMKVIIIMAYQRFTFELDGSDFRHSLMVTLRAENVKIKPRKIKK